MKMGFGLYNVNMVAGVIYGVDALKSEYESMDAAIFAHEEYYPGTTWTVWSSEDERKGLLGQFRHDNMPFMVAVLPIALT